MIQTFSQIVSAWSRTGTAPIMWSTSLAAELMSTGVTLHWPAVTLEEKLW